MMTTADIPTIMKHGKAIGAAANAGDTKAKEVVYWYTTSHRIRDQFGLTLAEQKAADWVRSHNGQEAISRHSN